MESIFEYVYGNDLVSRHHGRSMAAQLGLTLVQLMYVTSARVLGSQSTAQLKSFSGNLRRHLAAIREEE